MVSIYPQCEDEGALHLPTFRTWEGPACQPWAAVCGTTDGGWTVAGQAPT